MGMIPNYKDIVELIKQGATVEAQEKIMELREAVIELQDENHALKLKVRGLEEELRKRNHIEFDGSVYWQWLEDDSGDANDRDGPYCQRCYDDEQKLIRLQDWGQETWFCLKCKTSFNKK